MMKLWKTTLLAGVACLSACGGGEPLTDTGEPSAQGFNEVMLATAEDAATVQATSVNQAAPALAAADDNSAGHSETLQADPAPSGRATKLNYLVTPSNLRHSVWDQGGNDQTSASITAAGAIDYDAWARTMYRYRINEFGELKYARLPNGDTAVQYCQNNLEQCRQGTTEILKRLNNRLRTAIEKQSCTNGTNGASLYDSYNSTGRGLLAVNPRAIRVVVHGAVGLAVYTGINWYADAVGPYDRTKLSSGVKQTLIYLVGGYLTSYIGADIKYLGAAGLVTLQNTALWAQRAALEAVLSSTTLFQSCPQTPFTWWSGVSAAGPVGFDIEMGIINPVE